MLGRLLPQARDVFAALKDAALRVAIKITYANLGKAEQHPLILPTDFLLALASRNRLDLLLPAKICKPAPRFWKNIGSDSELNMEKTMVSFATSP